jgi:hypothetical protein
LLCAFSAEPISINAETDKAMRKPKKEDAPSFVMFQTTTEKLKKDAFNQERKVSTRCMAVLLVVFPCAVLATTPVICGTNVQPYGVRVAASWSPVVATRST